jgi:protein SMG8
VRLGGAKYYKPTKGLLQIGFSSKEKYLIKWIISVVKAQVTNGIQCNTVTSSTISAMDLQNAPVVTSEVKSVTLAMPQNKSAKLQNSVKQPEMESANGLGINFRKGVPNFTMKSHLLRLLQAPQQKIQSFLLFSVRSF